MTDATTTASTTPTSGSTATAASSTATAASTTLTSGAGPAGGWPLWEVFIRSNRGLSHVHAGSLHAADAQMALANARDLYTRRSEGVSLWVVPSAQITASEPDSKDSYFEPAADKVYRHPTFYARAEGVPHL